MLEQETVQVLRILRTNGTAKISNPPQGRAAGNGFTLSCLAGVSRSSLPKTSASADRLAIAIVWNLLFELLLTLGALECICC